MKKMRAYLGYLYGRHRSAMGNVQGVSVGKLLCLCVVKKWCHNT